MKKISIPTVAVILAVVLALTSLAFTDKVEKKKTTYYFLFTGDSADDYDDPGSWNVDEVPFPSCGIGDLTCTVESDSIEDVSQLMTYFLTHDPEEPGGATYDIVSHKTE